MCGRDCDYALQVYYCQWLALVSSLEPVWPGGFRHIVFIWSPTTVTQVRSSRHIYLIGQNTSPVRLSVRWSVRLLRGWISQKWLKVGSCNCHHRVAQSLWFLRYKFNTEILMVPPVRWRQTRVGWGKQAICQLYASISRKRYEIRPKLLLVGSCICAFDWHQGRWPWMTLNRKRTYFPVLGVTISQTIYIRTAVARLHMHQLGFLVC